MRGTTHSVVSPRRRPGPKFAHVARSLLSGSRPSRTSGRHRVGRPLLLVPSFPRTREPRVVARSRRHGQDAGFPLSRERRGGGAGTTLSVVSPRRRPGPKFAHVARSLLGSRPSPGRQGGKAAAPCPVVPANAGTPRRCAVPASRPRRRVPTFSGTTRWRCGHHPLCPVTPAKAGAQVRARRSIATRVPAFAGTTRWEGRCSLSRRSRVDGKAGRRCRDAFPTDHSTAMRPVPHRRPGRTRNTHRCRPRPARTPASPPLA